MQYSDKDFLETADSQSLEWIAKARELTRRYYQTDFRASGAAAGPAYTGMEGKGNYVFQDIREAGQH